MGNGQALPLTEDADSVRHPGTKCWVSDPIPEDFTYEEIFDEIMERHRYPVLPVMETILKSVEDEELGKNEIAVKVVMDGKKLDAAKRGNGDGADFIQSRRVKFSKDERYVEAWHSKEDFADKFNKDNISRHDRVDFLTNPLRLEYSCALDNDSKRVSGGNATENVSAYISGVFNGIQAVKGSVRMAEGDSLSGDGQRSVVSDNMDELCTIDSFQDALIKFMHAPKMFHKNAQVEEVSETEWKILSDGGEKEEGKDPPKMVTHYTWDKRDMMLKIVAAVEGDDTQAMANYWKLHTNPFRVEVWREVNGKRSIGRGFVKTTQLSVSRIIGDTKSWW